MWKFLVLSFALTAGTLISGAESARIKGDGCSVEFAKDKVFITNGANQRLLLAGKMLYTWTRPVLTPADAEVTEENTLKVTYKVTINPDAKATPEQTAQVTADAESIALESVWKVEGRKITATYTLSSPKIKPDGAMFELVGQSGAAKKPIYAATVWRMRPFGGSAVQAKDGSFRSFVNKNNAVWLKLPGNTGWTSGWAEHAGFKKTGDVYTTTLEFVVTPADFTGDDMTATRHGYPASLAFDDGKLLIRNLGEKPLENAVLTLGDKEEAVSVNAGEVLTIESGEATTATLKADDKTIYIQK